MKELAKIIGGDTSDIPADRKIIVPTLIIKQQDAPAFIEKMDKLLGQ